MLGMELKMERNLMYSRNHKHVQAGCILSKSTIFMRRKNQLNVS